MLWSTRSGNPLRFLLTPGQTHDLTGADALLPHTAAEVLIADKAYDGGDRVLKPLASGGKSAVIPPRQNRIGESSSFSAGQRRLKWRLFSRSKIRGWEGRMTGNPTYIPDTVKNC
jgi:transposase